MIQSPDASLRLAGVDDIEAVACFYQQHSELVSLAPEEAIIIAETAGEIIGAARLCNENGILVLRTMYVAEFFRSMGIGKRMLQALDTYINQREAYCIPYRGLIPFYTGIGFRQIALETAPSHLHQRLVDYRNEGHDAVIMKRTGGRGDNLAAFCTSPSSLLKR